jgi:hypothetical protein
MSKFDAQIATTVSTIATSNISNGIGLNWQPYDACLTKEEKDEYEQLMHEHKVAVKQCRLEAFKGLSTELRQFIINQLTFGKHISDLHKYTVNNNPRLTELTNRNLNSMNMINFASGSGTISAFRDPFLLNSLPEGITVEDIQQSHLERCLEEQLLDEET